MPDETSGILEVRVWLNVADAQVLIAERFRKANGRVTVIWQIDPKTILGVMWVEDIGTREETSAS